MSSGAICALALLDACMRLLVNVVNDNESCINEPFSGVEGVAGFLEYPLWRRVKVPDLFLATIDTRTTSDLRPGLIYWNRLLWIMDSQIFDPQF